jgi:hypothetical protein
VVKKTPEPLIETERSLCGQCPDFVPAGKRK